MGYFQRLPLSLKVIGLTGLLLAVAVLAVSLSHFLQFFSALGFSQIDDSPRSGQFASILVLLSWACMYPVAAYAARFQRGGSASPVPAAGLTLRIVALLAILPLTLLALVLFAPSTRLIVDITFWLGILAVVLITGWFIYSTARVGAAGSSASVISTASTAAEDSAGSAATPDTAGSGGDASMDSSTRNPTPFKTAWWAFDLGRYRPCDGTYCFNPYETIPPIRALNGTLDWLGPLDPQTDREMEIHRNAPDARGKVAEIEAEAAKLGLTLPEAFVRLMGSPELQDHIPSCTACTFGLPRRILPCIGSDQGYLIRFLNDQQDVLIWYLFLTPAGEQRVIVTPYEFDEGEGANPNDLPADQRSAVIANTAVCAPSFEAFAYRWWLENTIWFKLNTSDGDAKLTEEERRYLAHYAPTPN